MVSRCKVEMEDIPSLNGDIIVIGISGVILIDIVHGAKSHDGEKKSNKSPLLKRKFLRPFLI